MYVCLEGNVGNVNIKIKYIYQNALEIISAWGKTNKQPHKWSWLKRCWKLWWCWSLSSPWAFWPWSEEQREEEIKRKREKVEGQREKEEEKGGNKQPGLEIICKIHYNWKTTERKDKMEGDRNKTDLSDSLALRAPPTPLNYCLSNSTLSQLFHQHYQNPRN